MTLLQTLNDTTFNQKNADNIQKYVKKARKKVHYISAFISMKYKLWNEIQCGCFQEHVLSSTWNTS